MRVIVNSSVHRLICSLCVLLNFLKNFPCRTRCYNELHPCLTEEMDVVFLGSTPMLHRSKLRKENLRVRRD